MRQLSNSLKKKRVPIQKKRHLPSISDNNRERYEYNQRHRPFPFKNNSHTQPPTFLFHRHALGEITGTVDVAALQDGNVEREQLHGDDGEDALQTVDRLGHLQGLLGEGHGFLVALLADDDGLAVAGRHLKNIQ